MSQNPPCPATIHQAGDELHGFRITRVTAVEEIRATAVEAIHLRTGARLLHLHCADPENLYALALRTPPRDSTGVPHILEHSVLAGSEKYPVKDAFTELGKGSLKTFINAFTAPDFTCYPVASQVKPDFYNLASVYTDLVFRPLLTRNTFMQEGHHLEVNEEGGLEISGIVYNEMKGAFSTAEAVSERITLQALMPDTPYGHESGGDPEHIPDLTYEGFRDFHSRYYSPTNCRIFFYGDIPTQEHMRFLEGQLDGFDRVEVDSSVSLQPRWTEARRVEDFYPVGPEDPLNRKTTVNIAWLTAEAAEVEQRLILQVLEEALVGTAASPLRKALIDSGLGEDLSPVTGLQTWLRQAPFAVGLRGTDPDKAADVERLTLSILETIANEGIPRDQLEAAFHQVEFKGLEISRSSYPFPLVLLFRALPNWLHGQDPVDPLRFPSLMRKLHGRWDREPELFRTAVRRWFVDNPHRLLAVIAPSSTLAAEQEEKERRKLAAQRTSMTKEELEEVRRRADALLEEQRTGESPEALASLPVLRLDDIPLEAAKIPTVERRDQGVLFLEHELFTNEIAYIDIAFDVSRVPEKLQLYLPLLAAAVTGMGAAGLGYEAFATRMALHAGMISSELRAREHLQGEGTVQLFVLRGAALLRHAGTMVQILSEILSSGDLEDLSRLRDILSEERNELRALVAPRGHLFGWRSAAATLSLASHRDEQWHGATQVRFLYKQTGIWEQESAKIQADLKQLRELVFCREGAIANLTGDGYSLDALRGPAAELLRALPPRPGSAGILPPAAETSPGAAAPEAPVLGPPVFPMPRHRSGVALPGDVCYVARVLPAPKHNDSGAPVALVLANYLGDGILYRKIRVEGGAYGGMAVYNPSMGQFAMLSYRDPNLEQTFGVYDSCLEEFLKEELDSEDMRKAVISTIAHLDRPMDPATSGLTALERYAAGLRDEDRQRFREAVLRTDAASMRRGVKEILMPAVAEAREAVYAPGERIETANAELDEPFAIEGLE